MIIDLSECVIAYDTGIDLDTTSSHSIVISIRHLTKEKRVVFLAAEAPNTDNYELTDTIILTLTLLHTSSCTAMHIFG